MQLRVFTILSSMQLSVLLLVLLAGAAGQHADAQSSGSRAAAAANTPAVAGVHLQHVRLLQQTDRCSVQKVADMGCDWCKRTAIGVECVECKQGYVLRLTGVNCNVNRCCNMIPVVPPQYTVKIRKVNGKYLTTDINLLNGVKDENLNKTTVNVVAYASKWGTGKFLTTAAGAKTGVYRFVPNQAVLVGSSVVIKYNVEDQYAESAQGSIKLKYVVNSPPVLGRSKARLRVLTAGVTATYPLKDIRQALAVKDPDGDIVTIAKATLRYARGDKVVLKPSTQAVQTLQYYCPSTAACANYDSLGNQIKVNLTDGAQFVVGWLIMPVKPRPDLVIAKPYVLTGKEGLDTIYSVGIGALESKGFGPLIRVEFNQNLEAGDMVPGASAGVDPPLLPVWIPDGTPEDGDKADAVEFYPDENYDAIAIAGQVPVPFADLDAFKKVLTVFNTFVPASQANAQSKAAAASAGGRPDRPAAAVGPVTAQASQPVTGTIKPAASSCSGCIIDQTAACVPNPNDPFGAYCAGACVMDMNGNCYVPGEDQPCTSCILDAFGNCMDNGSGNCDNCVPDSFGQWCVEDTGQGIGGGSASNNDPYEWHAWLVPPVKTTAIGFWVTFGCTTSGNFTVEFNAADDEDFDGVDSDKKDDLDTDREIDPRRDPVPRSFTGRHRRFHRKLQGGSSSSDGSRRRYLLQDLTNRSPNGYGQNRCYTLDPGMVISPAAAVGIAVSSAPVMPNNSKVVNDAGDALSSSSLTSQSEDQINKEVSEEGSREVHSEDGSSGSSSSGSSGGRQRRLLARQEEERETRTTACQYYSKKVRVQEPQYACVANSGQRVGIWFAAWLENPSGYIRQVRIQADVVPGGDNGFYVGSMVLSQTQPWDYKDPLLRGKKRRRKSV